jgi:uncharacterized protein (DUF169 family)
MHPQEIEQAFEKYLKLRTRPVAVKLYQDRTDLPQESWSYPVNLCQLISMARYQGASNSVVPEKIVCALGAACVGLIRTPEVFSSGKAPAGVYTADEKAGKQFIANTFKVGDQGKQYDAALFQPLATVEEEPDVVIIYANPAQVMRLIHACTYDNGEKVTADTVAEAAVCSAIGFAASQQKPVIGFPCVGDRIFGGVADDELVFAAPYNLCEKLVAALEATANGGISVYPVPPNESWVPAMPPVFVMQPEYLKA